MDHYNEQLVQKATETKDMILRVLISAAAVAMVALSVFAVYIFGFFPLVLIALGACYLAYIFIIGTFVEYEYIVTNNDLDIDKISGKRKRKRLITVKLNTVTEWGEYTDKVKAGNISATVMASDATGYNAWYIIAKHEKYGNILVIFTPAKETIRNINYGVPYSVRKREAEFGEDKSIED